MFARHDGPGPEPIGFLLVPQFSMMAFFSAIEPLRVANRLAGRTLFAWHLFSADGGPVEASNGIGTVVEAPIERFSGLPTLVVCAGFEPERYATRPVLAALRRIAREGATLVALDTGAHLLARAGLLEGVRATMHWEAVSGFREDFPEIEVSDELFEVSGRIVTCAGGTAALDLMLDMIRVKHGEALAVAVSEQFIHDRIRDRSAHQRMQLSTRLGVTNGKVIRIVETMERTLERPLDGPALAAAAGVSSRHLERLFRTHLGTTPASYYLGLRLERARQLLRQTDLAVIDVAVAAGFSSAACLSRAYRARFGLAPRYDRSGACRLGAGAAAAAGERRGPAA